MPYAVPPGQRIAYDLNGAVGLLRMKATGQIFDIHPTALTALNSERSRAMHTLGHAASRVEIEDEWIAIMLPTAYRLRAVYVTGVYRNNFAAPSATGFPVRLQTSPDSTNGDDGTWTDLITASSIPVSTPALVSESVILWDTGQGYTGAHWSANDAYRRYYMTDGVGIHEVSGPATRQVRAVRFIHADALTSSIGGSETGWSYLLHLYGEPDTAASTDRLALWQPDLDLEAPGSWFNWGDIPPGSSADITFRVKNLSASKTASTISVDAVAGATTTTPAPNDSMLFSTDGLLWEPVLDVGSLGPGAVSPAITVRRTTPLNAQLSNWAPRIIAEAGSWT